MTPTKVELQINIQMYNFPNYNSFGRFRNDSYPSTIIELLSENVCRSKYDHKTSSHQPEFFHQKLENHQARSKIRFAKRKASKKVHTEIPF